MNISLASVNLLKFVVTYTGQRELNQEGKEELSLRRLNGDESAQRRFFVKTLEAPMKPSHELMKKWQEDKEAFDVKVQARRDKEESVNPRQENESEKTFVDRIVLALNSDPELKANAEILNEAKVALNSTKIDVDVVEKTMDFLKKYFVCYGDEVGYYESDDAQVEELNAVFGL